MAWTLHILILLATAYALPPQPFRAPACDAGGRDFEGRLIPQVPVSATWSEVRLGACAARFDAAADTVWGPAGAAQDASMALLAVSPRELWLEISDDTFVHAAENALFNDHVEIWASAAMVDECLPGSAVQWLIPVGEGPVVVGYGELRAAPTVERRTIEGGMAMRVVLPWDAERVTIHYSDSDDGLAQERLVGTNAVRPRGMAASLGRIQWTGDLFSCASRDGVLQPVKWGLWEAGYVRKVTHQRYPDEHVERFPAGHVDGLPLTVVVHDLPGDCPSTWVEVGVDPVDRYLIDTHDCLREPLVADNEVQFSAPDWVVLNSERTRTWRLRPLALLRDQWVGESADYQRMAFRSNFRDALPKYPRLDVEWGTARLGDCAQRFDASSPVWGASSAPSSAEMRVLGTSKEMWLEIRDDVFYDAAESWVNNDHLELWLLMEPESDGDRPMTITRGELHYDDDLGPGTWEQWAIDIPSGRVRHASGSRRGEPVAEVRVLGPHEVAVRITFASGGFGVVYSDSDEGRQARLVGTTHYSSLEARHPWTWYNHSGRFNCEAVGGSLKLRQFRTLPPPYAPI